METSEIIRSLCRRNGISVTDLEKELGFGNGSLTKSGVIRSDRLLIVAKRFNVSMEYLMGEPDIQRKEYYFDDATAEKAQEIFDSPDLRILFDAARNSKPEDLQMAADLLKRLKTTNPDA